MSFVLYVIYLVQLFSQSSGEFAVLQSHTDTADPLASGHHHTSCRSAAAEIHQRRSAICATIRRVNTVPPSGSCTLLFRCCCFLFVRVPVFIPSPFPEGFAPSQCVTRRLLCDHSLSLPSAYCCLSAKIIVSRS